MRDKGAGKKVVWLLGACGLLLFCLLLLFCGAKIDTAQADTATPLSFEGDGSKIVLSGRNSNGEYTIEDFTNVHYITNKDYFVINPLHFDSLKANNSTGACTTIAAQLLLGYHNYYSDRRLIPVTSNGKTFLSEDYGSIESHPEFERAISSDNKHQGCGRIGTQDGVYNELFDLNWVASFSGFGQAMPLIESSVKKFIGKYTPVYLRENIALEWGIYSEKQAKFYIDSGEPIILGFSPISLSRSTGSEGFHVVVAYGYAQYNGEDGYLVHYGWGDDATQVWVPEDWIGFQLRMNVNHAHSMHDTGKQCKDTHRVFRCSVCGYEEPRMLFDIADWAQKENATITGVKYPLSGYIQIPHHINSNTKGNITVATIGASAFAGQADITDIFVSSGIESIHGNAFANCTALQSVYISSSVTSIAAGAFGGCDNAVISVSSFNDVYASQDGMVLSKDGSVIVAACKVPSAYTIPAAVAQIAPYAFAGNGNLTELYFHTTPDIGAYAFAGCFRLGAVYFTAYMPPQVGESAFEQVAFNLYAPNNALEDYKTAFGAHTSHIYALSTQVAFVSLDKTVETRDVPFGSTLSALPVPEEEGYTFGGWFDEEGNDYVEGQLCELTENTVLYAKQTPNTYTVTLNAGEGTLQGDSSFAVTYGAPFSSDSTATRVGYVLDGWQDGAGKRYMTANGVGVLPWDKAQDSVFYAVWSPKTYEVQINADGTIVWLGADGSLRDENCRIPYGTVLDPVNLVPTFKNSVHGYKEGHIFDHFEWDNSEWNWTSIPDIGEDGAIVTIEPIWIKEEHTLYFNTLCDIRVEQITALFDTPISLATPTRTGYIFDGWQTDAGDIFRYVTMPDLTVGVQSNGSVQLKARWLPITYTVQYKPNGGVGTMGAQIFTYDVAANLKANAFSRSHYRFMGWALTPNGNVQFVNGQLVQNITTSNGGTITLYAVWKGEEYAITYLNITFNGKNAHVFDRVEAECPTAYEYGVGLSVDRISANFIEVTHFTARPVFLGWYTDMTFGKKATSISPTQTGNVVWYAKWRYDHGYYTRQQTFYIDDGDQFKQDYYDEMTVYFKLYGMYDKLSAIGCKYVAIHLQLRMWEIDDGYQEIFIYGGEGSGNLLWSITDYEHGGGVKDTTKRVFETTVLLDLAKLKDVDCLYIRYGAHGKYSDDWASDLMHAEISCVVDTNDLRSSEFYWAHKNPFYY